MEKKRVQLNNLNEVLTYFDAVCKNGGDIKLVDLGMGDEVYLAREISNVGKCSNRLIFSVLSHGRIVYETPYYGETANIFQDIVTDFIDFIEIFEEKLAENPRLRFLSDELDFYMGMEDALISLCEDC